MEIHGVFFVHAVSSFSLFGRQRSSRAIFFMLYHQTPQKGKILGRSGKNARHHRGCLFPAPRMWVGRAAWRKKERASADVGLTHKIPCGLSGDDVLGFPPRVYFIDGITAISPLLVT